MQVIKAVTDEDSKFQLEIGGKTLTISYADVVVLYYQTPTTESLARRYDNLRMALSSKYGVEINEMTTYQILEKSVAAVQALKKSISS